MLCNYALFIAGDADFVDIIHSNMGSVLFGQYGTPQKVGHADFFPNGGSRQPACDVSLLKEYTIPRRGKRQILIFT